MVYSLPGFDPGPLDPNVGLGVVLAAKAVKLSSIGGYFICSGGIGTVVFRGTSTQTGLYSTYSTPVAGVGVRFKFTGSNTPGYWPVTNYLVESESTINEAATLHVELVKIGPITAGGAIVGEVGGWFAQNNTAQIVSIVVTGTIEIRPRVPTCTVATKTIDVPLGPVLSKRFTGVGSTSPEKPFKIALTCSGGDAGTSTRPFVTLTDKTNPGNRSTTLSLTQESGAAGVGIQILKDGTVLGYGPDSSAAGNTNQWSAGTIAQGTTSYEIPLSAHYVQTSPTITPGSADGRATFTMSYQ